MNKAIYPAFLIVLAVLLSACASSRVSVSSDRSDSAVSLSTIAIVPGSGALADAIAVELFNAGFSVLDTDQTRTIMGRVGLREFEITSPQGRAALHDEGIEAVLSAKTVDGQDGRPESASIRITSTESGALLAGVSWQNGWGGQPGSMADRTMRKNLADAAGEIGAALQGQINPAP